MKIANLFRKKPKYTVHIIGGPFDNAEVSELNTYFKKLDENLNVIIVQTNDAELQVKKVEL